VGRPWLRREDIRRDSLLPCNIKGWRRLAEDRDICGQTTDVRRRRRRRRRR